MLSSCIFFAFFFSPVGFNIFFGRLVGFNIFLDGWLVSYMVI